MLVIGLSARDSTVTLEFPVELDADSASDVDGYESRTWSLVRSAEYGSDHYDERELTVGAASVSRDHRSVSLDVPDLAPTWCMEIRYTLRDHDGADIHGKLHNTIHSLE